MKHKCLVALLVVFILGLSCQDLTREFLDGSNAMVGPDVDSSGVIERIDLAGNYVGFDEGADNLENRIAQPFEWLGGWGVTAFAKLRPLRFGNNIKIQSLTFINRVDGNNAEVLCYGLFAFKTNGVVQVRSGFGHARGILRKQYTQQTYRSCHRSLFKKKCHDNVVNVERGYFHHELEIITTQLKRHAAYSLARQISIHNGWGANPPMPAQGGLGTLFVNEANALRAFYREIEYDFTELHNVTPGEIAHVVHHASAHLIGDQYMLDRIVQVTHSSGHSCFMAFPHGQIFHVFCVYNHGHAFTLKMSQIRVEGQLPVGGFFTSVGTWIMERDGMATNPSIHQILGVFPALK